MQSMCFSWSAEDYKNATLSSSSFSLSQTSDTAPILCEFCRVRARAIWSLFDISPGEGGEEEAKWNVQFADRLNHSFSESFVKLCLCTHFDSFVVRSETTTKTMKEWKIVYLDCVCSLGERMFIGKRDIAVLNKKKSNMQKNSSFYSQMAIAVRRFT